MSLYLSLYLPHQSPSHHHATTIPSVTPLHHHRYHNLSACRW
ncbi:hypothetical protein M8C21_011259 [Ambrosia artemisiifolia]|uniref:Uncharacterized protein n=1 Tax=Ambrosia artemisiifolia TaxID=4212 RepID=A0AAD5D4D9_AMBAR|nr:hypothetical protein M8C21_011259 [Ambrosia artemisiifolia]